MPLWKLPQWTKVVQLSEQTLESQLELRQEPRILVIGVDLVRKSVELHGSGQGPRAPLRSRESKPITFAGQFVFPTGRSFAIQGELMACQVIDELRNRQAFRPILAKLARKGEFVGRKEGISFALRVFDRQRFGEIPFQGEVDFPGLSCP